MGGWVVVGREGGREGTGGRGGRGELDQVSKQHLSTEELNGGCLVAMATSRARWTTQSRWLALKRHGAVPDLGSQPKQKKLRRGKTLVSLVQLNNMIVQASNRLSLSDFLVVDMHGTNPFLWPRLNLAPDQGPNCICLDSYLAYHRLANLNCDWDPSHGAAADTNGTIKEVGLWREQLLYCSAVNCVHGSPISPPRLQQLREATVEYLTNMDVKSCAIFHDALPKVVAGMELDIDIAGDTAVEECQLAIAIYI